MPLAILHVNKSYCGKKGQLTAEDLHIYKTSAEDGIFKGCTVEVTNSGSYDPARISIDDGRSFFHYELKKGQTGILMFDGTRWNYWRKER